MESNGKVISLNRLEKIAKIFGVKPYILLKENLTSEIINKILKE